MRREEEMATIVLDTPQMKVTVDCINAAPQPNFVVVRFLRGESGPVGQLAGENITDVYCEHVARLRRWLARLLQSNNPNSQQQSSYSQTHEFGGPNDNWEVTEWMTWRARRIGKRGKVYWFTYRVRLVDNDFDPPKILWRSVCTTTIEKREALQMARELDAFLAECCPD